MEPTQLLFFVAILVLFWLLIIRPASRRQKAMVQLQQGLQVGQRVMLASGLFGTIASLAEDRAHVEIAPGVQVEVMRAAVTSVDGTSTSSDATGTQPDSHPDSTGE